MGTESGNFYRSRPSSLSSMKNSGPPIPSGGSRGSLTKEFPSLNRNSSGRSWSSTEGSVISSPNDEFERDTWDAPSAKVSTTRRVVVRKVSSGPDPANLLGDHKGSTTTLSKSSNKRPMCGDVTESDELRKTGCADFKRRLIGSSGLSSNIGSAQKREGKEPNRKQKTKALESLRLERKHRTAISGERKGQNGSDILSTLRVTRSKSRSSSDLKASEHDSVLDDDELQLFNTNECNDSDELLSSQSRKFTVEDLNTEEKMIFEKAQKLRKQERSLQRKAEQMADFHSQLLSTKVWKPRGDDGQDENLSDEHISGFNKSADLDEALKLDNADDSIEVFDESVNLHKKRRTVSEKYGNKTYQGSLTSLELNAKAEAHISCVESILNGSIQSVYYAQASTIAKESNTAMPSVEEFRRISFDEFTIGFYGIQRQTFIAKIIARQFKDPLTRAMRTNKTAIWWGRDNFVLYVLAAEVGARIAAEELHIDLDDVYDLFLSTVDYGKYITDLDPIE